ncbi:MAG: hypothetical protein QM602_08655, partial [Microbacterium sp.]
ARALRCAVRPVTARPPRPAPVPPPAAAEPAEPYAAAEPSSAAPYAAPVEADAVEPLAAEQAPVEEERPADADLPADSDVYTPETDTGAYRVLGFGDVAAQPSSDPAAEAEEWRPQYARTGSTPTPEPEPEPARVVHQAFWALAPEERDVHDERGVPIFRIGPTAWALVIEDRGSLFVIRHEDGRIGYLHDVTGVTRG